MFLALDKNGNRVSSYFAKKSEEYYCPICFEKLILKQGEINASHFAHETLCKDNWNYGISEWHLEWQKRFPENCREVVVERNGVKHRADVLVGNTVIEFQHSGMTKSDFDNRNEFFLNNGFRLIWIFDMMDRFECEQIIEIEDSDESGNLFQWKNPMKIFADSPKLSEYNKDFALYFEDELGVLYRVTWAISDEYGYNFKRFIVTNYLEFVEDMKNVDNYFRTREDEWKNRATELKKDYQDLSLKYSGIKGKRRNDYICPKDKNKFGINILGQCDYCSSCGGIGVKKRYNFTQYSSICCYPSTDFSYVFRYYY